MLRRNSIKQFFCACASCKRPVVVKGMAQENAGKDVEMAAEGEEKEEAKEGGEEADKQQVQKDKDLLTFEGE